MGDCSYINQMFYPLVLGHLIRYSILSIFHIKIKFYYIYLIFFLTWILDPYRLLIWYASRFFNIIFYFFNIYT